ncbi:MAG TPA: ferrochelatase [Bacteroidia bacterium]|nr:ferrochelatase [Bacteroidia bacterium]
MSTLQKTGILLLNLGTPDSPKTADERKYLREFLCDPRVLDIPWLQRQLLVKCVIAPLRGPKSAKQYEQIWTKEGSPLLIHSLNLSKKLQQKMGDNYVVELGMRYQSPPVSAALQKILTAPGIGKIIIVPLYPQYSASATSSSVDKVIDLLKKQDVIPPFVFTGPFYDNPLFIEAFAKIWKRKYRLEEYDYFLFSYHGLPERHIMTASKEKNMNCKLDGCCDALSSQNYFCYRASCFHTTRLLANALQLKKGTYSAAFQSRLGKDPWIKPYTDKVIIEKAESGVKKMLVFSPAFVADCLETIYEVKVEYARLFKEYGGETLHLAESLNDNDEWVEALEKIITSHC